MTPLSTHTTLNSPPPPPQGTLQKDQRVLTLLLVALVYVSNEHYPILDLLSAILLRASSRLRWRISDFLLLESVLRPCLWRRSDGSWSWRSGPCPPSPAYQNPNCISLEKENIRFSIDESHKIKSALQMIISFKTVFVFQVIFYLVVFIKILYLSTSLDCGPAWKFEHTNSIVLFTSWWALKY